MAENEEEDEEDGQRPQPQAVAFSADWVDLWTKPMIEPPAQSPEEQDRRAVVSHILQHGWNSMDGYDVTDHDLAMIDVDVPAAAVSSSSSTKTTTTNNNLSPAIILSSMSSLSSLKQGTVREGDHIGSQTNTLHSDLDGLDLPSTYGEVTELGARQLFHLMGLTTTTTAATTTTTTTTTAEDSSTSSTSSNNSSDRIPPQQPQVFYDLGSGVGRLVAQAYMELVTVDRLVGIELGPSRHLAAKLAWELVRDDAARVRHSAIQQRHEEEPPTKEKETPRNLNTTNIDEDNLHGQQQQQFPPPVPPSSPTIIDFYQGNLLDADVSDATHIFVSSCCFTDTMMYQVATKLINEAPHLKCVASIKKLPMPHSQPLLSRGMRNNNLNHNNKPQTHGIEMTWTESQGTGCLVYFYFPQEVGDCKKKEMKEEM